MTSSSVGSQEELLADNHDHICLLDLPQPAARPIGRTPILDETSERRSSSSFADMYPPSLPTINDPKDPLYPDSSDEPLSGSRPKSLLRKVFDGHLQDLGRDPTVLTTSTLVSSRTLFWWRVAAAAWVAFIVPWDIAQDAEEWVFYFTHLTWVGLGAWFAVAAFQTARYNRDGTMNAFLRQSKFTRWLTWNLYIMPACFHLIVPIVFWSLLSSSLIESGRPIDWWINLNVHAFDFVLILVEFILGRTPIFYSQWPSVIGSGLLFLAYSFFQHAVYHKYSVIEMPDGWYVYSFLNTSKKGAWAYYVALIVGFVAVFCFVVFAHKLRDRMRSRRSGHSMR